VEMIFINFWEKGVQMKCPNRRGHKAGAEHAEEMQHVYAMLNGRTCSHSCALSTG